jgi:hypothetical protein
MHDLCCGSRLERLYASARDYELESFFVTSISRSQRASGRLSTVNYRLFPISYCNNNIIGSNMRLNYVVFIWSHISLWDVHQTCYCELRVSFFGSLHGTFRSLCHVWMFAIKGYSLGPLIFTAMSVLLINTSSFRICEWEL